MNHTQRNALIASAIAVGLLVGGVGLGLPATPRPLPRAPDAPGPLADPTFANPPQTIDTEREGLEGVVSVAANDVVWMSGMRNVGDEALPGNLWRVEGANVQHESPNVTGTGDATIYVADDGKQYWAVMKPHVVDCNYTASHHKLNLGYRAQEGQAWQASPEFDDYDRPWFVRQPRGQSGDPTVLTATRWCAGLPHQPVLDKHLWMLRRIEGAWVAHEIFNPAEKVVGGFPRYLSGRTPGGGDDPALDRIIAPFTTAIGNTGNESVVIGSVSYVIPTSADVTGAWVHPPKPWLGNENATGLPWAAVDDAGRLYITWAEIRYNAIGQPDGQTLKFAHKANPRDTSTGFDPPFTLASTMINGEIWGPAAVAGAEGRLAVAWYERNSIASEWQVKMRYVFNAHSSPSPVPSDGPKVVDAAATDAGAVPVTTLRDFLSVAKLSSGNLVIAYSCNHALETLECGVAGVSHPRLAKQTGGDNLNGDASPPGPVQPPLVPRLPIRLPPPPEPRGYPLSYIPQLSRALSANFPVPPT